MKLELFQRVTVNRDVADENVKKGDVAWLIDYIAHPHGGEEGAILEVYNVLGESVAVVTVPISAIEPLRADQIPSVRSLKEAI